MRGNGRDLDNRVSSGEFTVRFKAPRKVLTTTGGIVTGHFAKICVVLYYSARNESVMRFALDSNFDNSIDRRIYIVRSRSLVRTYV